MAFDHINHSCLWYKLYNFGIKGKMISAIQSLYNKNSLKSTVCMNNTLTGHVPIECSVSQGDTTSPTLFAVYVNDLVDIVNAVNRGITCGSLFLLYFMHMIL